MANILAQYRKVYGGSEALRYFATDNLGSRRVVYDSSGTATDGFEYSAYGELSEPYGSNSFLANFTGKELDATGLYYFNSRYYDSNTGRFLQEDSAAQGDGWYTYCSNNPINFVDLDGKQDHLPKLQPKNVWEFAIVKISEAGMQYLKVAPAWTIAAQNTAGYVAYQLRVAVWKNAYNILGGWKVTGDKPFIINVTPLTRIALGSPYTEGASFRHIVIETTPSGFNIAHYGQRPEHASSDIYHEAFGVIPNSSEAARAKGYLTGAGFHMYFHDASGGQEIGEIALQRVWWDPGYYGPQGSTESKAMNAKIEKTNEIMGTMLEFLSKITFGVIKPQWPQDPE